MKQVRGALGLTQIEFLPVLNAAAKKVGAAPYSQSKLSKLESGSQDADFDDIAAFAEADPLQRGRLWLAWGDQPELPVTQNVPADRNAGRRSGKGRAG